MLHLDLFSGIGGFAYAVDQVWPGTEHIFCDNDKFCQQVLKKHWPNSKIYEDIRTITDTKHDGHDRPQGNEAVTGGNQPKDWLSVGNIGLLTGGFPCQPFSQAGRRKGTDDNRYLWPWMLRLIRLTKPRWVIGENVAGLLTISEGLVFEQVCSDLEAEGYEVQPFIIPAVAVNAPHRRDRVWIIANKSGSGQLRKTEYENNGEDCNQGRGYDTPDQNSNNASNPNTNGLQEPGAKQQTGGSGQLNENDTDSSDERLQGNGGMGQTLNQKKNDGEKIPRSDSDLSWGRNWLEVATELCRVDDGLSEGLDFAGFTKAQHRVQRLKALGNAIVPAVAVEIMKAIKANE